MPALGSCIVWHNQALHLLPQFYVANALLKAGHVAEQAVWRSASLHAQLLWCPSVRQCHSIHSWYVCADYVLLCRRS